MTKFLEWVTPRAPDRQCLPFWVQTGEGSPQAMLPLMQHICVRHSVQSAPFPNISCTAAWEEIPWGTLIQCSDERPMTPSSLQQRAVCVIWRGHWVPYHSCFLCTMTCYGEFTLRHVRAKWCRLILCHMLMSWILYCCRYAHLRDNSDSQSPSTALFHAGHQTASPFVSSAPVGAKSAFILFSITASQKLIEFRILIFIC